MQSISLFVMCAGCREEKRAGTPVGQTGGRNFGGLEKLTLTFSCLRMIVSALEQQQPSRGASLSCLPLRTLNG